MWGGVLSESSCCGLAGVFHQHPYLFWRVIRSDRFSWAFWGIFVSCSSFSNPRMPLWIRRERFLFASSALAQVCTFMCRLCAGPERWEPPVHRSIASPVWWWLVLHCFPFAALASSRDSMDSNPPSMVAPLCLFLCYPGSTTCCLGNLRPIIWPFLASVSSSITW